MICYIDIPFGDVAIIKDVWGRNRAFHEEISDEIEIKGDNKREE
jgi:hypothetical protein